MMENDEVFVLCQNDSPIEVYLDGELAKRVARERTGDKPTIQTGYFHVYKVPVITK